MLPDEPHAAKLVLNLIGFAAERGVTPIDGCLRGAWGAYTRVVAFPRWAIYWSDVLRRIVAMRWDGEAAWSGSIYIVWNDPRTIQWNYKTQATGEGPDFNKFCYQFARYFDFFIPALTAAIKPTTVFTLAPSDAVSPRW